MAYSINHTRAESCRLHRWEASFPFPVPPSLFSGSLSRGWQLSHKGEAGIWQPSQHVSHQRTDQQRLELKMQQKRMRCSLEALFGLRGGNLLHQWHAGGAGDAPWKKLHKSLRRKSWFQRTLELSSSVILLCCTNSPQPFHFTAPALSWDTSQAAEPVQHLPALPSPEEEQLQPGLTQLKQSTDTSPDAQCDI